MLMRLTRVVVPSVRASPTAGKPARLGSSPALRASVARRMKPMHRPPEQLSPPVAALRSSHGSALFRFSQPTEGGVQRSVVHALPSTQLRAPPRQAPAVHVSPTVQALPSVQAIPLFRLTEPHTPAPLQALLVQIVAAVQGEPTGSNLQVGEQQSPASLLPSSQASPASRIPLPQTSIFLPVTVKRGVCTPPAGRSGPSTLKKLVPQGLPVMVCGVSPSPMNPAGAGGRAASHWRKLGPTRLPTVSGPKKPGAARPESKVTLMAPRLFATRVSTP